VHCGTPAGKRNNGVSGLAAGIDTGAHTAALRAKGGTIAAIGTVVNHFYPAANKKLQEQIADVGLVLRQF
jgi:DNA processing protein